jgi:hypothetical protein
VHDAEWEAQQRADLDAAQRRRDEERDRWHW